MKELPLSKVYALLEPGPVVLLATARKGRPNVMTMSWHMMLEFEPPLVACVCSGANYSFEALRATGECVIALPARKLAAQVVKVGGVTKDGQDYYVQKDGSKDVLLVKKFAIDRLLKKPADLAPSPKPAGNPRAPRPGMMPPGMMPPGMPH